MYTLATCSLEKVTCNSFVFYKVYGGTSLPIKINKNKNLKPVFPMYKKI